MKKKFGSLKKVRIFALAFKETTTEVETKAREH